MKNSYVLISLLAINLVAVVLMTNKLGSWSEAWGNGWFLGYFIIAIVLYYLGRIKKTLAVCNVFSLIVINMLVLSVMSSCSYGCKDMPGIGFGLQFFYLFIAYMAYLRIYNAAINKSNE